MGNKELTAQAIFWHEPTKSYVKINFTGETAVRFQDMCYRLLPKPTLHSAALQEDRFGERVIMPPREYTITASIHTRPRDEGECPSPDVEAEWQFELKDL